MKYVTTLILASMLVTCSSSDDTLSGTWTVQDKFISTTYRVEKSGDVFNALVLSYDDGTTRYQRQGDERHYVFTNVTEHDGIYVDGISGATPKADQTARLSIQTLHPDTLAVTTYLMGRPVVETWTRKAESEFQITTK